MAHRSAPRVQLRTLGRGATLACPVCGKRGLFRRYLEMAEHCPRCELKFERQEGTFVGAVGVNTILSFGVLLAVVLTVFIVTYPDIPAGPWVFGAALAFAPIPILLYPFSKTIWLAMELVMRPLEDGEALPKKDWHR